MPLCSSSKHDILPRTELEKKLGCNRSARSSSPTDPRGDGPASSPCNSPRRRAVHSLSYSQLKLREPCGDHPENVMRWIRDAAGMIVGFAGAYAFMLLLHGLAQ